VGQSRVEMIFSTADGQVTFFADGKDDIHVTGAFWFREDEGDGCGAPGGRCCDRHRVLREAHDATALPCDAVRAAVARHSSAHDGTWRWWCVFCTAPCALHSAGWRAARRSSAKDSPTIAWSSRLSGAPSRVMPRPPYPGLRVPMMPLPLGLAMLPQ
jgi:hypothetical protein